MLTTEQLLQKRFKFISPYPGGHWEIGEVFELCGSKCYAIEGMSHIIMHESILMAYPHIFQPLPWWSDRDISDMPEYLHCPSRGTYHKVSKWDGKSFVTDGKTKTQLANYTPTTRAEYEQYNQQKEGKPNE